MGDISSSGFPTKIQQVTYSNPVFAFFNIHSYKDDGITDEEYACQPNRGDIDIQNDPDDGAYVLEIMQENEQPISQFS